MAFYGAGDHGGGATKINIQSIEELKAEEGAPKVFYSTPERYFQKMREDKNLKFPVVNDDLQHHAVGCYTAEMEIKKGNRQSEAALMVAEKIAAIGSVAWKARYPKEELTSAWQRVLFLQFHDSLAGTSVPDHSNAAREGYGYAIDIAKQTTTMAVQKLEWQIASEDPDSQYMVVFNPHAWENRKIIEYDFNWGTMHKSSRVDDEKGNPLTHQWTAGTTETGSRKTLLVDTVIPAMGYRQIRLWDGESPAVKSEVKADGNNLENEYLRVRFSKTGAISLFDKESGKEVFAGENGCKAVVIDDPSDTWSHDIKTFADEIGAFENASVKVLEAGPLRAITRVTTQYGNSTLTIDWILVSGSRNLEAKVTLDWHEHLKMLKFSFPVDVESPVATYETPYGFINRETNGNEEPGQRWIDVTGKMNASVYGLTVINDAKYGYNVAGNDMRISVARSAVYAHHNPRKLDMQQEHIWMDQGRHTFKMLLVPHKGTWKESGIVRLAEEFVAPAVVIYQGIHGGNLPKSGSFLSVDAANIVVTAVKLAETNDDLIVRCVETSGQETTATMDLRFTDRKWKGNFHPNEIKTLRINKISGEVKEVDLLEE
jgi:alpha-mannosidase